METRFNNLEVEYDNEGQFTLNQLIKVLNKVKREFGGHAVIFNSDEQVEDNTTSVVKVVSNAVDGEETELNISIW